MSHSRATLPLNGIRVLDFGTITAGAACSTLLLDLGADVIKVEGPGSLDPFRNWQDSSAEEWWNRSPMFAFTNRGKQSVCLDLKDPRGQAIIRSLLETCDVLVENYRRGVLAGFGLDPSDLRRDFPRLIIASISSQGETGPDRDMVSFGSTLEATSGLAVLTGSAAAPVVSGRGVNYPDQIVSLFAAGAILAGLAERDGTGLGAHLDLSQRELTSFLLGEELIAAAAGIPSPRGSTIDQAARVVADGTAWRVEWPGGTAPVRDGMALIAAAEFRRGTAVLHSPDGLPAKGIPFRLQNTPLSIHDNCHALGADNHAVLAKCGYDLAAMVADGILAVAPRRNKGA